jgi:hypothetical protein
MNGKTPPPAIVALTNISSSSSPRIASCKWRGVIRFTCRSLDAFPREVPELSHGRTEGRIIRRPTRKFENLCGKIFKDRAGVDGSLGTYPNVVLGTLFQKTVNTTDRKLEEGDRE